MDKYKTLHETLEVSVEQARAQGEQLDSVNESLKSEMATLNKQIEDGRTTIHTSVDVKLLTG